MDFLEYLKSIYEWMTSGIYDFFVQLVSYCIAISLEITLKSTLFMLRFSWDVAYQLMQDLQITTFLNDMYAHIDSSIMDVMLYFRVPDFINVVMNAYITRYVFSFLGGKGIF